MVISLTAKRAARAAAIGGSLWRRPGLAGLLASTFALGMGLSFVMPFLSLWGTREVKMTPAMLGVFMTVTTLSAIVVSTTLARWSDTHVARKTMLLLGGLGGVLGYVGYAFVRDPVWLTLIGSTLLALSSVCFSQLFAHVRETFASAEGDDAVVSPSFFISVVRVCFSFAWTVGPAIAAWVMVSHGFRGAFLGAALLYLGFLVGVWCFVPFRRPAPAAVAAARLPVWRVLARRDLAAVFAAFLLFFASHAMNMMNLPLMVTQGLGGTERHLGIVFGVGPVVEIPLMLWFGYLANRGHQLRLLRLGALISVVYFLGLGLVQEPWHVYPLQILSGAAFAILSNVAIMFFQDLLPGQAGLGTAIFGNAMHVGNLAGYFAFGSLAVAIGQRGLFVASAILGTVTLVILLLYRPRHAAV